MGRPLGSGTFGDVYTCRDRGTGEEFACKSVPKKALRSRRAREELGREVALMRVLKGKHPGVVQLQETTESADSVHILMEICSGGDLFDLICTHGRLPEPAAHACSASWPPPSTSVTTWASCTATSSPRTSSLTALPWACTR